VWVEIYRLKPAQAQASRATFPTHWGRKGSRLWRITSSSRSTRPRRMPTAPYGLAGSVVELGRSPDGLARMLGRSPQSDRLPRRVQAEPLSHLEADEQPNSGNPLRPRNPSGDARAKPSGRSVTYVPDDPSFETPDDGGPSGGLTGASIPTSQPSRVQLAVSKPAHPPLSRAAADSYSYLCRASRAPRQP
jgi:hypothetical protein